MRATYTAIVAITCNTFQSSQWWDQPKHLCQADPKTQTKSGAALAPMAHMPSLEGIFITFIYHNLPILCLAACSTVSKKLIITFSLFVVVQHEQMLEFIGVAQVDLTPFGTSLSRDHAARGMLILKKLYVHKHALLLVDGPMEGHLSGLFQKCSGHSPTLRRALIDYFHSPLQGHRNDTSAKKLYIQANVLSNMVLLECKHIKIATCKCMLCEGAK